MKNLMIGNSMKPTLPFISFIIFKKQEKYNIGDIVVFTGRNGLRYCHRIVSITKHNYWSITKDTFTAKGDNRLKNKWYETDVPINNIIGKLQPI